VRLLQLERWRITQSSLIVRFRSSLKRECFQGTLEDCINFEFCLQPVQCSWAATENSLSQKKSEFQTDPGNDVVAVWRVAKSRSWWDISDCSQHASQVGWRLANSRFVHKDAQFIVDPLLDRQPVQLYECWRLNRLVRLPLPPRFQIFHFNPSSRV